MNERDELLAKFNTAMPLVNELNSLENKSIKYNKTKSRLAKIIVIVVGMLIIGAIPMVAYEGLGAFISGSIPFDVFLALMIYLSVANKKKIKATDDAVTKIFNSDELSFIPFSYRNSVNICGIYMVLVDMRAYSLTDAINIWEQDKHNMVMEAKSSVIV